MPAQRDGVYLLRGESPLSGLERRHRLSPVVSISHDGDDALLLRRTSVLSQHADVVIGLFVGLCLLVGVAVVTGIVFSVASNASRSSSADFVNAVTAEQTDTLALPAELFQAAQELAVEGCQLVSSVFNDPVAQVAAELSVMAMLHPLDNIRSAQWAIRAVSSVLANASSSAGLASLVASPGNQFQLNLEALGGQRCVQVDGQLVPMNCSSPFASCVSQPLALIASVTSRSGGSSTVRVTLCSLRSTRLVYPVDSISDVAALNLTGRGWFVVVASTTAAASGGSMVPMLVGVPAGGSSVEVIDESCISVGSLQLCREEMSLLVASRGPLFSLFSGFTRALRMVISESTALDVYSVSLAGPSAAIISVRSNSPSLEFGALFVLLFLYAVTVGVAMAATASLRSLLFRWCEKVAVLCDAAARLGEHDVPLVDVDASPLESTSRIQRLLDELWRRSVIEIAEAHNHVEATASTLNMYRAYLPKRHQQVPRPPSTLSFRGHLLGHHHRSSSSIAAAATLSHQHGSGSVEAPQRPLLSSGTPIGGTLAASGSGGSFEADGSTEGGGLVREASKGRLRGPPSPLLPMPATLDMPHFEQLPNNVDQSHLSATFDHTGDSLVDFPPSQLAAGSQRLPSKLRLSPPPPANLSPFGSVTQLPLSARRASTTNYKLSPTGSALPPPSGRRQSEAQFQSSNVGGVAPTFKKATILTCTTRLKLADHAQWAALHEEYMKVLLQCSEDFEATVVSIQADRVVLCWNALTPYPFHEVRACHCAIHMAAMLDDTIVDRPSLQHLQFCISVVTGGVVVGLAGTSRTVKMFVEGFSVAAGQALSALGLYLNCRVVVAEGTFAMARSQVACFPIDVVSIDDEQFLLFEIVGKVSEVSESVLVHRGFSALCSRNYEEASLAFSDFLQKTKSGDAQVRRLLRLVEALGKGQLTITDKYSRRGPSWLVYPVEAHQLDHDDEETLLDESIRSLSQTRTPTHLQGLHARKLSSSSNNASHELRAELERQVLERSVSRGATSGGHRAGSTDVSTMSPRAGGPMPPALDLDVLGEQEVTDHRGQTWRRSEKLLGRGTFGVVHLGMASDGSLCAIKTLHLPMDALLASSPGDGDGDDSPPRVVLSKEAEDLIDEVSTLSQLKHDNVVRYLGSAIQDGAICIVMEYISGGSLTGILELFGQIPIAAGRRYICDVLRGLRALHEKGCVHRDVGPNNVLLTIDGSCKLTDFGCSGTLEKISGVIAGTPQYMAPEACCGMACPASDVWSVGVLLHVLLTGMLPFPMSLLLGPIDDFITRMAHDEAFPIDIKSGLMTADATDFVSACLVRDATKRPSADQLLLHHFVLS